jgi:hypothetical protein
MVKLVCKKNRTRNKLVRQSLGMTREKISRIASTIRAMFRSFGLLSPPLVYELGRIYTSRIFYVPTVFPN